MLHNSCLYMAVLLDDYHFDNPLHIEMQVNECYNEV